MIIACGVKTVKRVAKKLFPLSVEDADDAEMQETLDLLRSDGWVSLDAIERTREQT